MTIEQALKIKQNWTAEQARNDLERLLLRDERPANKVIALACKALEKQIPKKVIEKVNTEPLYDDNGMIDDFIDIVTFECSCCNNTIATGEIDRYCCADICYCDNCGQKLDWESDTK